MSDYHLCMKPIGLNLAVRRLQKSLRPIMPQIKFFVGTGHSGIVPMSVLTFLEGKQMIIVRKPGEESHGTRVEGPDNWHREAKPENTCMIDDFVNNGETVANVMKALRFNPGYLALYYDRFNLISARAQRRVRVTRLDKRGYLWRFLKDNETWPRDERDADGVPLTTDQTLIAQPVEIF